MKKINVKNSEILDAEILKVEKGSKSRQITSDDVAGAVAIIERRLAGILPKSAWQGLRFECDPNGQSFPGAYKGVPFSTQFILERGSSAWFVTRIWRGACCGPTQHIQPVNLVEKRDAILNFLGECRNW